MKTAAPETVAAACEQAAFCRPAEDILVDGLFNEAAATIRSLIESRTGACAPAEPDFARTARWFFARTEDADWWHGDLATREEAIAAGRAAYPGETFWIEHACRMVPSFNIFDAAELFERIGDDECWWENGWEGEPDHAANSELEAELAAVLRRHVIKHGGTLAGACLDGPSERIEAEFTASADAA